MVDWFNGWNWLRGHKNQIKYCGSFLGMHCSCLILSFFLFQIRYSASCRRIMKLENSINKEAQSVDISSSKGNGWIKNTAITNAKQTRTMNWNASVICLFIIFSQYLLFFEVYNIEFRRVFSRNHLYPLITRSEFYLWQKPIFSNTLRNIWRQIWFHGEVKFLTILPFNRED